MDDRNMTQNDQTKHKNKSKRRVIIPLVIAVLLVACGIGMLNFYGSGSISAVISDFCKSVFGGDVSGVSENLSEGEALEDNARPELTLYLKEGSAVDADKITSSNLRSPDGFDKVKPIYDGNPDTCIDCPDGTTVLDAGEVKNLAYIKYLPNCSTQDAANSCIGTKFYASKDNVDFVELGTVMPDVTGDLSTDWHIIEFSGYGLYRYFKVVPPPYASISEVEWVCNNGIVSEGRNTSIDFVAYNARNDYHGLITLAVYNRDGALKTFETQKAEFLVGEYTPVIFSHLDVKLGDYIKILAYDSDSMKVLVGAPLEYRYTEASGNLELSNIYSDNMVLQADEELVLSGKAPSGSIVTAELTDDESKHTVSASATVREFSDWKLSLGTFRNGGSYTLRITADNVELEYKNITFGDVFVFAGQSNMEFYLCGEKNGEKLLKSRDGKKQASSSNIRLMNMYTIGVNGAAAEIDNVPLCDWNGYWTELTPESAAYVSAISYYFSKELNQRTGRNIGIISVAVGDTEINRWYPRGEKYGSFEGTDGRLYNNRIYPFTKMKIKGILWYQGEADMYRTNMNAGQYSDAMAGLVDIYREKWNQPNLPFYYAQVARYGTKDESEIREGQRLALRKIANKENTAMISLLDIIGTYKQGSGCARTDIHPWQKEIAAKRFVSCVMCDLYNGSDDFTGPEYESSEINGSKVIITFKHKGRLKVMDKSQYADSVCDENIKNRNIDVSVPHEFSVVDAEGKFYPADAEIIDDKVVVQSDSVSNPVGAVYAWGAYPEMPNLTDDTNLPVSTFDTRNGSAVIK